MSEFAQLRDVDPNLSERYHNALKKAMEGREDPLSYEEIQAVIDQVNEEVRRERMCKLLMCMCTLQNEKRGIRSVYCC